MVNYIKVIKRAILGNDSSISVDTLPQGADMVEIAATTTDWEHGTPITLGTVNATYPCGIASVSLNNFADDAADWQAEVIIRSVSITGTILARIPFAGHLITAAGISPQVTMNLPKMPVVGPGIELFASLASADTAADTADVKITTVINV